jgi:hypothetical protein
MGSILDIARRDIKKIVSNGGFETELIITPINQDPVTINGIASRHTQSFDTDGLPMSDINAHCTFIENDLNDNGIVTRDANGNLNIKNWIVEFTDEIATYKYKFAETWPDNTLGNVRVTLTLI